MKVGLFHPGTQHSRQTARALEALERLAWFATSIYPSERLTRAFPRLAHFRDPDIDDRLVRSFGGEEWLERGFARAGLRSFAQAADRMGNHRFARRVAGIAAGEDLALWGFDGSSAATFRDPRLGARTKILDRTIGDWRSWNRIADHLRETWGDWVTASDAAVPDDRISNDREEYQGASHILCGAPFVARTIAEHEDAGIREKLRILPYCHDDRLFQAKREPEAIAPDEPIRFLFVGHLSLRKGLPILLEAFARLPDASARLTLAGELAVREAALRPYLDRVDYLGRVPRGAMPDLMRRHHVLVLPSWFEGSAITLLEARAMGLAVIQSDAAGIGADGSSGIVIGEPDTDRLEAAMASLLDDRAALSSMRVAAWRGASRHDHAAYTRDVADLLAAIG